MDEACCPENCAGCAGSGRPHNPAAPGERYDIEFVASETGAWMLHCHILHHTTNDNVDPGGLMMVINVTG
jgi:FtsP/CotA-like multicopper oxidase with cupredoxin domain